MKQKNNFVFFLTYFCNIVEIFLFSVYNLPVHYKGGNEVKTLINILTIFAGIVLGGYLGELAVSVPALKFLSVGQELGLSSPLVVDLDVLKFTLGFTVKFNIAGILGFIVALIVIKKVL